MTGGEGFGSIKFLGPIYGSVGAQTAEFKSSVNFRHGSYGVIMSELTLRRFHSVGGFWAAPKLPKPRTSKKEKRAVCK